jgi:hypothetical protein
MLFHGFKMAPGLWDFSAKAIIVKSPVERQPNFQSNSGYFIKRVKVSTRVGNSINLDEKLSLQRHNFICSRQQYQSRAYEVAVFIPSMVLLITHLMILEKPVLAMISVTQTPTVTESLYAIFSSFSCSNIFPIMLSRFLS